MRISRRIRGELLRLRPAIPLLARFCLAFTLAVPAGSASASGAQSAPSGPGQMRNTAPKLELGEPTRVSRNQIAVPLFFLPIEGTRVGRIHAEIIVPEGPWRFRKVESPKGSSLKTSARRQREAKTDSQGNQHRVDVVLLSLSAGRNLIVGGQVAQLHFSLERPDSPTSAPLAIRTVQTMPPEPQRARDETILEPPPVSPPMNPAPTCFFFAH